MNIYLGNLSVKQIQQKSGVTFPQELITFLENNNQESASNIAVGKWHCFDIPFCMVCGDIETAKYIYSHLCKLSKDFKQQMSINIQKQY